MHIVAVQIGSLNRGNKPSNGMQKGWEGPGPPGGAERSQDSGRKVGRALQRGVARTAGQGKLSPSILTSGQRAEPRRG